MTKWYGRVSADWSGETSRLARSRVEGAAGQSGDAVWIVKAQGEYQLEVSVEGR